MDASRIQGLQLPKPGELNAERPDTRRDSVGEGPSFADALENAIREVDQGMVNADEKGAAYLSGAEIDLHDVVLEMQKADLQFKSMVQVRNKLIEAYKEIMRTPV